jgi:hypothetical protein
MKPKTYLPPPPRINLGTERAAKAHRGCRTMEEEQENEEEI